MCACGLNVTPAYRCNHFVSHPVVKLSDPRHVLTLRFAQLAGIKESKSKSEPPAPASAAASAPALDSDKCTVHHGKDYPGGDINTAPAAHISECCDACSNNVRCVLAVFCKGVCYMKGSGTKPPVPKQGCDTVVARPDRVGLPPWLPNRGIETLLQAMPSGQWRCTQLSPCNCQDVTHIASRPCAHVYELQSLRQRV